MIPRALGIYRISDWWKRNCSPNRNPFNGISYETSSGSKNSRYLIPAKKIHDFSLHQFPTVNLLHELEEHTGINVTIIAAQIEYIPAEIEPGLSEPMTTAVSKACEMIMQILSENSLKR